MSIIDYNRRVGHGEKVVIAKNNLPLVDLVPDNFIDEDSEINEMFYGEERIFLPL